MYDLINKIEEKIDKCSSHILKEKKNEKYYKDFINEVEVLYNNGCLNKKKDLNQFINKLQLDNYNEFKYYQGLAEIIFWIYCSKNNYNFELEKKLRDDVNTDVDVQIVKDDIKFNIEIKCPKFEEKKDGIFKIIPAYRSLDKEDFNMEMDKLHKEISEEIVKNSNGRFKEFKQQKINDNKILDYLKSAQTKFSDDKTDCLNILVVSVRSEDMQSYWNYLYNPLSGLFTENSFHNSKDYNKVDIVILSNLIEGHISPKDEYNSWCLENYCNIICLNSKKENLENNEFIKKLIMLECDIIPNDTIQFEGYMTELIKFFPSYVALNGLLFSHYMNDHYKSQWDIDKNSF